MSFPNRQVLFALIAMIGIGLAVLIFAARRESKKGIVKTTSRPTIDSLINVHGSPKRGLRVCGEHFGTLLGVHPFWMPVPDTSLVLFAYEAPTGDRTLVVCNTNTCTFDEIPLSRARFGNQIGRRPAPPHNWGDRIESVCSNKVVLISVGFKYSEKSILDLNENSVKVIELKDEQVAPLELPY